MAAAAVDALERSGKAAHPAIDPEPMPPPVVRPVPIALLVAGALFMEFLDGTVITTALPAIAGTFGTDPVALGLAVTAYLVTIAVLIPISGWIADRYGACQVFSAAIVVFTGASILCGLSGNVPVFIAARILQGVGGAMMVPVGRLVVLRVTAKKDLLRAIAYLTWPALAAPIIGPAIGGFITQTLSWRWIFFLNVPLGLVGLAASLLLIPREIMAERTPFDARGFVLAAVSTAALLYGLDMAADEHAHWPATAALLGVGLVAGLLAVRHMRRAAHPLFDLTMMGIPTFAVAVTGGSLFRVVVASLPFLLPLFFQVGLGYDPFHAGLLVLTVFAGNLAMKVVANQSIKRFGYKRVLIANGCACAALIAACALITRDTPVAVTVAILFAGGMARSLQLSAVMTLSFADIPAPQMSGANAVVSMLFQLNTAFGVALGALALRLAALAAGHGTATTSDFRWAFAAMGALALVAVADCLGLRPDAGHAVSSNEADGPASAGAERPHSASTRGGA